MSLDDLDFDPDASAARWMLVPAHICTLTDSAFTVKVREQEKSKSRQEGGAEYRATIQKGSAPDSAPPSAAFPARPAGLLLGLRSVRSEGSQQSQCPLRRFPHGDLPHGLTIVGGFRVASHVAPAHGPRVGSSVFARIIESQSL